MADVSRKWIHQGGIARLAYSRDGAHLFTAGGESFVRVFSGDPANNDDDSLHTIDHREDGQAVLCLDCSMESLVVGYEDGTVELLDITSGSYEVTGMLTRSDLGFASRSVKFSPNGQRVAVASDETAVKVIDVRDTKKIQMLEGHERGIRALSWSPDGQLVTTSSSDGTMRVFDVSDPSTQEPTCIQIIDGVIAAQEPEVDTQCEAVWHPTGKYFVVGTKSHELAIISRESWEREGTFDKDGHDSEITTLAFSPNGRYLSSSGKDEKILVWDCSTRRVVLQFPEASGPVSSLAWRSGAGSNSISYIDKEGNLVRWDDVIAEKLAHPNDAPAAGAASRSAASAAATKSKPSKASRDMELDDDDLDLDIGGTAGQPDATDEEDDFIEDDDDDGVYKSRFNKDDDDDLAMPAPLVSSKSKGSSSVVVSSGGSRTTGSSLVKGQEPFQPGATPPKDKRRYLAFNMLGVIHIVERDSHNIVEIDFHDQSTHGRIHFDDFNKFSLASLGPQGAVYASSNKELGSTVAFKPFDSWGSSSAEWSLELPPGELATCLAISSGVFVSARSTGQDDDALESSAASGTVLAATTSGYLRFFSATGTQKYIINLGEQVVALAAGKDWAMVIHRTSELIQPGRQDLTYTMFDLDTYEIVQRGKVPLAKDATLAWIGFAEDQLPYMYDSNGLLSALSRSRRPMQGRWVPMLDTRILARRENRDETYWPVGATEKNFMCIFMKGQEKHPYFPVPITQDIPLQIPLINVQEPAGESEASFVQLDIISSHLRDCLPSSSAAQTSQSYDLKSKISVYELEMDKSILKLLQIACKADRQQQALDLARTLSSSRALTGAKRLAGTYSLKALEMRIDDMIAAKENNAGTAYRERQEKQKREGKYAHLADERVIPDSSIELAEVSVRSGNPLAMPFANGKKREKKTAKNVFSDMSAPAKQTEAPAPVSRILQGNGAESEEDNEPFAYEREDTEPVRFDDEEEAPRARLDSVMLVETPTIASSAPKARTNPFAKRPAAAKATTSTPVSSTSTIRDPFTKKGGNHTLQKTDSFFERVDASTSGSSSVSTKAVAGGKQSTLFGSRPPAPKEKEASTGKGRGRKRKSDAQTADAEEGGSDSQQAKKKSANKLDSFWKKGNEKAASEKAVPANDESTLHAAEEPVADADMTVDETQFVDAEDSLEGGREASAAMEEGNSTSTLDNEASAPVTPADELGEEPSMDEEPTPTVSASMSKLEASRHTPTVVESA